MLAVLSDGFPRSNVVQACLRLLLSVSVAVYKVMREFTRLVVPGAC